jgi:hypothetical protein
VRPEAPGHIPRGGTTTPTQPASPQHPTQLGRSRQSVKHRNPHIPSGNPGNRTHPSPKAPAEPLTPRRLQATRCSLVPQARPMCLKPTPFPSGNPVPFRPLPRHNLTRNFWGGGSTGRPSLPSVDPLARPVLARPRGTLVPLPVPHEHRKTKPKSLAPLRNQHQGFRVGSSVGSTEIASKDRGKQHRSPSRKAESLGVGGVLVTTHCLGRSATDTFGARLPVSCRGSPAFRRVLLGSRP